MATKPMISTETRPRSLAIKDLLSLMRRRRELVAAVREEEEVAKVAIAQAKARKTERTKPVLDELKDIDQRLKELLLRRKRAFWARLGKTITTEEGEIRYRTGPKSLDTPKNTSLIVNFFLQMRGGDRYLTWTPTLNRDAITNAHDSLHQRLKPLGVWVGKHAYITVRSSGEDEPTTLDRRRYPNRP